MMKITKLYSGEDNKSYFTDLDCIHDNDHPLGKYSKQYPARGIIFREFEAGLFYDWHNAPQEQYIIYLEGEVEVQASGGETRVFKRGDVLLAADLVGVGHTSKTLTKGMSIIVVV